MERDPDRNPETHINLNDAPQEELPPGEPLSPTGSQESPATTQPVAPRAEEVAAAQIPPPRRRSGALAHREDFLGMRVICDLNDRDGHRLLAAGETITSSALAEIEAAGCLGDLAGIVRPPLSPVAPLGME